MLYIKNGIIRDSSKTLQTEDGRTIFNAPQEQWEAEGWVVCEPEIVPEPVLTFEDKVQALIEEARAYRDSIEIPYSREERVALRQMTEDLLEAGYESAPILEDREEHIDLTQFTAYLKALNVVEIESRKVLEDHISAIELLSTEEELENYNYTENYPELPELPVV